MKEAENTQSSPAATSPYVPALTMGAMALREHWLMEHDKQGRRRARTLIQGQIFLLLTCPTTYFGNYFHLRIKALIWSTQYSLMSTEREGERLRHTLKHKVRRHLYKHRGAHSRERASATGRWGELNEHPQYPSGQKSSNYLMQNNPEITATL